MHSNILLTCTYHVAITQVHTEGASKIYCTGRTNVHAFTIIESGLTMKYILCACNVKLFYIKLVGEQLWQLDWSILMSCDQSDCHV